MFSFDQQILFVMSIFTVNKMEKIIQIPFEVICDFCNVVSSDEKLRKEMKSGAKRVESVKQCFEKLEIVECILWTPNIVRLLSDFVPVFLFSSH